MIKLKTRPRKSSEPNIQVKRKVHVVLLSLEQVSEVKSLFFKIKKIETMLYCILMVYLKYEIYGKFINLYF